MKIIKGVDGFFDHVEIFLNENYYNIDATILLGYQNMNNEFIEKIKNESNRLIIYQLEQLVNVDSNHFLGNINFFVDKLKIADEIWDYDNNNIEFLKLWFNLDSKHVMLTYSEKLKKINNICEKSIDVLFYGANSERRLKIIDEIRKNDINIVTPYTNKLIFSNTIDEYISKSKIVLNLHNFNIPIQEQVRIFYLLNNDKCVLSEKSLINYYGDLIIESDEIVESIKNILNNNIWQNYSNISEEFKIFSQKNKN